MIDKIKLKTSFDFDAAHRLVGYLGKCLNLHGHIWHVDIEIEGDKSQLDDVGILWDFTNVKTLKDMFDHKTILKNCDKNVVKAYRDYYNGEKLKFCKWTKREPPGWIK